MKGYIFVFCTSNCLFQLMLLLHCTINKGAVTDKAIFLVAGFLSFSTPSKVSCLSFV